VPSPPAATTARQPAIVARSASIAARSTAFPQPAPGAAPTPGPMKVEAGQLRRLLGVREVHYVEGTAPLAVVERPLA